MRKFSHAKKLIEARDFNSAKDILEDILLDDTKNVDVLYNLGMCFSELGQPLKAIKPLEQCLKHDADYINAYVALGYAYSLLNDYEKSKDSFLEALRRDPANPYALRNLGGLFGKLGDLVKSLYYLTRAYEIAPTDPGTVYGLAFTYDSLKDVENASKFYRQLLGISPDPRFQDMARDRLSILAINIVKLKGFRMDIVYYMLKALSMFNDGSEDFIRRLTFEISVKGQNGFDINNPTKTYTLDSLSGEFTGLQLISYMYVGFQMVDDGLDTGIDLRDEYRTALKLFKSEDIIIH